MLLSELICWCDKHSISLLFNYFQAIKEEEKKVSSSVNTNSCAKTLLVHLFSQAVDAAYPALNNIAVPVVPNQSEKFGDYQFNGAMQMCQVTDSEFQEVFYITSVPTYLQIYLYINIF